MERSSKERFMKRVGQWLGVNYRFYRFRNPKRNGKSGVFLRGGILADSLTWTVMAWRRVPGNPRNEYVKTAYKKYCDRNAKFIAEVEVKHDKLIKAKQIDAARELREKAFGLSRSKCFDFNLCGVKTKDEAIDKLLLESDFLDVFGRPNFKSYEALEMAMRVSGVDAVPYAEKEYAEE